MSQAPTLLRLQLLVEICRQLPEPESDRLHLVAIDDPRRFAGELLELARAGRLQLSKAHLRLLRHDHTRRADLQPAGA